MKFNFKYYFECGIALGSVFILAALIASCSGSASSANSSTAVLSTTTSAQSSSLPDTSSPNQSGTQQAPNRFQRGGTIGTLNTINGNTLVLTSAQGSQVTVDITDNTSIEKTIAGTASDLQQGVFLTVTGTQNSSGDIEANSIIINLIRPPGSTTPSPGTTFTTGTRAGRQGNGAGSGFPNSGGRRATIGTLTSVNGNTLTLATAQGNQVIVDMSDSTSIQKTVAGSISDLQPGQSLTVMGAEDANGDITADTISIRLANPGLPDTSPGT